MLNWRWYQAWTSVRLAGLRRRVMVRTWAASAQATARAAVITVAAARARATPRWASCPALRAPRPVSRTPMTVMVVMARAVTASIRVQRVGRGQLGGQVGPGLVGRAGGRTGLVTGSRSRCR